MRAPESRGGRLGALSPGVPRALTLAAALALALACALPAIAGPAGTMDATGRRPSIQDSPGYRPAYDPESLATGLGRRLGAPSVRSRFRGGARNLDELGRAICRALHHARRDSLLALSIDEREFREILWREFPQSRPATGLTWEDGWKILYARLYGGAGSAIEEAEGQPLEFVRFDPPDTVVQYRNFRLHNGLRLVVSDGQGQIERLGWLRSVAERKGVFKIYSVKD